MIVAEALSFYLARSYSCFAQGGKPQESFDVRANLDMKSWVGRKVCGWGLARVIEEKQRGKMVEEGVRPVRTETQAIRIPVLGPLRSVFQKEEMQRSRQRAGIVGVKGTSWLCLIGLFLVENSQQRSHRMASLLETEARIPVFLAWGPGATSLPTTLKPGN